MRTTTTLILLMIATGLAGCAGQVHRSHSFSAGSTVLVCEHKATSARFATSAACTRVDGAEMRQTLIGPPPTR
jgi:hypothetical protein